MTEKEQINENVEVSDVKDHAEATEVAKNGETVANVSKTEEKSEKMKQKSKPKPQRGAKTPKKKGGKAMTPFEESKDILGKVCNKFKDCTLSPTASGNLRIKRGNDIICCANAPECKITIPVEGDGLRTWHDNRHMTRIPHGHKDLSKLFEQRCKDKRTNREVEVDVYEGGTSPGHARLSKLAADPETNIAKLEAEIADAKKKLAAERKKSKAQTRKAKGAQKARKGTKAEPTTA